MAYTEPGVLDTVRAILQSAAAGYAFGEAALFAVNPILTQDNTLMTAVTVAAKQAGSITLAVITPCLAFTLMLLSLACGLLLAALVMKLWAKVGLWPLWLVEVTTGASVVVGAVSAGVLVGLLPPRIYNTAQYILAAVVYARSNVNETIAALFVIFGSLFLGVVCGSVGPKPGLYYLVGLILFLVIMGRCTALRANSGCQLLQRLFSYCGCAAIIGFCTCSGLSASKAKYGSKEEAILIVNSVIWVTFMSAGPIGAQLGARATHGLWQDMAGKITAEVAILSSVAVSTILQWSSSLGPQSSMGGMLGAAAAAGFSLGGASVAGRRNSVLAVLISLVFGTTAAFQGGGLKATQLTSSDVNTIVLVAAAAFLQSRPRSPLHAGVNLLTWPELIAGIGIETVTTAAAPIGVGAFGAAALGTAALGRVGFVGVLGAVVWSLGVILRRFAD